MCTLVEKYTFVIPTRKRKTMTHQNQHQPQNSLAVLIVCLFGFLFGVFTLVNSLLSIAI